MNIKNTFIELTSCTYPYGYEDLLTDFLPKGYKTDEDGNYFYEVGSGSKTIFASHLDTACKEYKKVTHKLDGKFIRTNGKSILGADDKAGVTILLYMIHNNVPGLYYFFVGEEVGCIGSTAASKRTDFFSNYNKIVSFDRRGTKSIITHQSSKRSCSDAFADSLSKEYAKFKLNLEKDDTGVYTDSAEFTSVIPECTNISVGYYNEHTHTEHQDIDFLIKLAKASVLVNWEDLTISRDPSKTEWKESKNYYYYGGTTSYSNKGNNWRNRDYNYNGFYGDGGSRKKTRRGNSKKNRNEVDYSDYTGNNWWDDEEYYGSKFVKKSSDFYYKDGQKVYYNDIENEMLKMEGMEDAGFSSSFVTSDNSIKIEGHKSDLYKGVKGMFLEDKIIKEEFDIIKEQCLDMLNECDRDFAKFMEANFVSE